MTTVRRARQGPRCELVRRTRTASGTGGRGQKTTPPRKRDLTAQLVEAKRKEQGEIPHRWTSRFGASDAKGKSSRTVIRLVPGMKVVLVVHAILVVPGVRK